MGRAERQRPAGQALTAVGGETAFAGQAVDLVAQRRWGQMVAANGTEIISIPMSAALKGLKKVPVSRYDEAKILFGR